jgi:hypothetical protein
LHEWLYDLVQVYRAILNEGVLASDEVAVQHNKIRCFVIKHFVKDLD